MSEQFDVIIVGAGLSGIGSAYHLQQQCPDKRYVILEARNAIGGTWDLFRYPGIRSDSDMYTLGYGFKPWRGGKMLADGPSIKSYVEETAEENGITPHIRFGHRVLHSNWDSDQALWTVTTASDQGERVFTGRFILMCAGYYSYDKPYTPDFAGLDNFKGEFFHAQLWPENLDYRDKKVVIIGSGATAVTLVPAMAGTATSVTMLQRSPSYYWSRSKYDKLGLLLGKLFSESFAYRVARWRNTMFQWATYWGSRRFPDFFNHLVLNRVRRFFDDQTTVAEHFTPRYNVWDERLCALEENCLFKAVKSGQANIVTDHIERFTENGILLRSGAELEADIVVSATGLNMALNGESSLAIDGATVDLSKAWTYKGMMHSGVPNLVFTFGYINASWTLRADLIANFACRLINHLDAIGKRSVTPMLRHDEQNMTPQLWISGFQSNYMQRCLPDFPNQGDHAPWVNTQNFREEKKTIGQADLDDGALHFT